MNNVQNTYAYLRLPQFKYIIGVGKPQWDTYCWQHAKRFSRFSCNMSCQFPKLIVHCKFITLVLKGDITVTNHLKNQNK